MTRQDYMLIANVLKGLGEDEAHCFDNDLDRSSIAERFAEAFAAKNPEFDWSRFTQVATDVTA